MEHFTIKRQFFLPFSEEMMREFDKIDKYMKLLENSGVWKIIESVNLKRRKCKGRLGYNPYNMFAAIVYSFALLDSSLRKLEYESLMNLGVIYILEGKKPNYTVFGDYINNYILPNRLEIFTLINRELIKELNLDISDIYDDGTKIEANANKYKFVWKPTKFHVRLNKKIIEFLESIGISIVDDKNLIKSLTLKEKLDSYAINNDVDIKIVDIPTPRGKRLRLPERKYKEGFKLLTKLVEYEEKEQICGDKRNSYYKTDYDATAMMLKEDYYSRASHEFHAAYNIQAFISSGLILMYGVFQDRTDYYTLIPMLERFKQYYGFYPKNLCADSGYGIYVNYQFLKENNIGNYVKFQSWKGEASGKSPQLFYTFDDGVMCLNTYIGELVSESTRHPRNKGGKIYKFEGCNKCHYKYICKKKMKQENQNLDYRYVELNTQYELFKEEARKNLLSRHGIEMRINRSIQIEGTFGQVKYNMDYERIRRRGLEKVDCEIMLVFLGANIRRFFHSLNGTKKFKKNYWNTPNDLQTETFKNVKPKKETVKEI